MMDIPMLLFASWPKISLMKVLWWKTHCHDANFACPVAIKILSFLINA
jgi:hypothetical protein